MLLTVGAASTDAISYLGLGKVFPANMTGNTVLLAVGTASGDYAHSIRSALALGGFVTGAVVAGLVIGSRPWRTVLAVELGVLLAILGWWLTLPDKPSGAAQLALIGMAGATMGAQSAAVSRLPVGVSTTYITGTWTAVSTWAASRLHPRASAGSPREAGLQAAVLCCYLAAAFGAGYLFIYAGPPVLTVPVAAVAAALALTPDPA